MGQAQTKIETKAINPKELVRVQPVEVGLDFYPFRRYRQLSFPNDHSVYLSLQKQIHEQINLQFNRYESLERALDQKTCQIVLSQVLFDQFNSDKWFYIGVNKDIKCSLIIRKFRQYQSQLYKNIVYQLHINKLITDLKCNNLHSMIDTYSINTKLEEEYPYSQIIEYQEIQVNLTQIIHYRRENNCQWTIGQFQKLCWDLISALDVLHTNNLTHNDIRPYNVYFSLSLNCFKLGNYKNVLKTDIKGNCQNIRLRIHPSFKVQQKIITVDNYSNKKRSDIYALGITLLCAFYMTEPIQRKLAAPFNRAMQQRYAIMRILRKMVKVNEIQPLTTTILKKDLQQCNKNAQLNIIQSIRFRNKIRNKQVSMINRTFSSAYKRMGSWDKWKQSIYDAYQIQSGHLTQFEEVQYYSEFSRIQKLLDNNKQSEEYAKKAGKIYQKIGYNYFLQNNYTQAVKFFNQGLKCIQSCNSSVNNILVKIYQGLALVFAQKQDKTTSKSYLKNAQRILASCHFSDKQEYIQIKFCQSKIHQYHLELDESQRILKDLQDQIKNQNFKPIYQVMILKKLGKNAVAKAQLLQSTNQNMSRISLVKSNQLLQVENQSSQGQLRTTNNKSSIDKRKQKQLYAQAEWNYIQALNLAKSKTGNQSYIQMILIYKNLGKLKFNQQNSQSAEYYFFQILRTLTIMKESNNSDMALEKQYSLQKIKAQAYCLIALCKEKQVLYQQMLRYYNLSLGSYKLYYGEYHNKICAEIIGNMSLGYQNLNMHNRAIQCIDLAIQILYDVLGPKSIDYNHFVKVRQMLLSQQLKTSKRLQQRKKQEITSLAKNLLGSILLKSNMGFSDKSIGKGFNNRKDVHSTSIRQIDQNQQGQDKIPIKDLDIYSQESQSLRQLELPVYITQQFGNNKDKNNLSKQKNIQQDWNE